MNHDTKITFKRPNGEEIYAIIPRNSVSTGFPRGEYLTKAEAFGINGVPMMFPNNNFSLPPVGINWDRFEAKLAAAGVTREEFEATQVVVPEPVNVGLL